MKTLEEIAMVPMPEPMGRSRLTAKEVFDIREDTVSSHRRLARLYHVSEACIRHIRAKRNWRNTT